MSDTDEKKDFELFKKSFIEHIAKELKIPLDLLMIPFNATYTMACEKALKEELELHRKLIQCLELVEEFFPDTKISSDTAFDPDDESPKPYIELSVDTKIPRREFRKLTHRIYSRLRISGVCDQIVIRRA